MTPELKAKISKEAEELYPDMCKAAGAAWDTNEFIRRSYVRGSTTWASKLQAIREEVEKRVKDYDERLNGNALFYTEILSIIDKHLNQP